MGMVMTTDTSNPRESGETPRAEPVRYDPSGGVMTQSENGGWVRALCYNRLRAVTDSIVDSLAAARAELAVALKDEHEMHVKNVAYLAKKHDDTLAQLATARRDARRYQWLREQCTPQGLRLRMPDDRRHTFFEPIYLDEAIDRALPAQPAAEGRGDVSK